MDIDLRKDSIYFPLKEAMDVFNENNIVNFEGINSQINSYLNGLNCSLELINNHDISDIDFYNKLITFARIFSFGEDDFYRVIEKAYNTELDGEYTISTTMHKVIQVLGVRGDNLIYLDEEVGIDLIVLVSKDFYIDYEHVYTVDEIKKYVNENKMVILEEENRAYYLDEEDYKKEEYHKFECAYDYNKLVRGFFDKNSKYYLYTLKYIREHLDDKDLRRMFAENVYYIDREISRSLDIVNTRCKYPFPHLYEQEIQSNEYTKKLKNYKNEIKKY